MTRLLCRSPFPWNFEEANLKFSKHQRESLARLGLFAEQIGLLEEMLPLWAFAIRKQPARDAVQSKLEAIQKPMKQALGALESFLADRSAAGDEALLRIRLVDVSLLADGGGRGAEILERAKSDIDLALKIAGVAQSLGRADQQRHKKAMLLPIGQIDGALQEGFRKHHEWHRIPQSTYTIRISRSGPFRDIVAICYEVIAEPDADPDRAIRTYLKKNKKKLASSIPPKRSRLKALTAGRQLRKGS